jgi:HTH-type transcriptional regulator / antitoxin HigA
MLNTNVLIKTEAQYETALERVYDLMQLDLKEGSKEFEEAELLSILIEQYEEIHYPI